MMVPGAGLKVRACRPVQVNSGKGVLAVAHAPGVFKQFGRLFDDYRQWVQDTLMTEPKPWIQVLAAPCNPAVH
jgi:hypothetical protein